jgi:hypothetical protein
METSSGSSAQWLQCVLLRQDFFSCSPEYKVAGPAFAHGGFQNYLNESITSSAVSFYRPVLSGLVLPPAVFLGYVVGIVDCWLASLS